jgi:hypothetical protein
LRAVATAPGSVMNAHQHQASIVLVSVTGSRVCHFDSEDLALFSTRFSREASLQYLHQIGNVTLIRFVFADTYNIAMFRGFLFGEC